MDTTNHKEQHLDDITKELINQLPDHIGELIVDLVEDYKLPLWQFVCGILLDSHQCGRLSAFQLDPAWKDGLRGMEYTCARCGKTFKAHRINQVYCSETCGQAAERERRTKVESAQDTKESTNGESIRTIRSTTSDINPSDSDSGSTGNPEEDVLSFLDNLAAGGVETPSNSAQTGSDQA